MRGESLLPGGEGGLEGVLASTAVSGRELQRRAGHDGMLTSMYSGMLWVSASGGHGLSSDVGCRDREVLFWDLHNALSGLE